MINATGKWMRILSVFLTVLIISTGMANRLITVVAAEINTEEESVSTISTDVSADKENVEIPIIEENAGSNIEEAGSLSENESYSNEQPAEEEPSGETLTIPTETADIMESSEEVTITEETISNEETETVSIEGTETTEIVSSETESETEISVSENSIDVQKTALLMEREKVQGEPDLDVKLFKDENNLISLVSSDESEVVAEDWAYNEIRILRIQADFTNTEGDRKIEIKMPLGMIFINGEFPEEKTDIITSCTFNPCELPEGYESTSVGGILSYGIADSAGIVSIEIPVQYDESLWNKQAGADITGNATAITVTMTAGEKAVIKVLNKVYTSTSDSGYEVAALEDAKPEVISPGEAPVMIGEHGIILHRKNEPDTTPKQYWKSFCLTQELPYRLNENKEKIYADYKEELLYVPECGTATYDESKHTISIIWTNISFDKGNPCINGSYIFTSPQFTTGDIIFYPQPKATALGVNGKEIEIYTNKKADEFTLEEFSALFLGDEKLSAGIYVGNILNASLRSGSETGESSSEEWGFSEIRTLKINFDFTGMEGERKLIIDIPVGITYEAYPDNDTNLFNKCEYTPCDYTALKYTPAGKKGGTLIYTMQSEKSTLSINIGYDEQLWNKQPGSSITDNTTAITVTMKSGDHIVEKCILDKIMSCKYDSASRGKSYYKYYDHDTNFTAAKPLDKKIYIGEHRVYGGRVNDLNSSPKLYWKKLRIEQEAPYKMVDEKKIYATYVAGATALPKGGTESYDPIKHITTVTYENAQFTYGQPSFNGSYSFPKELFSAEDIIYYPQPNVFVEGIYGSEYQWYQGKTDAVSLEKNKFKLGNAEDITIESSQRKYMNFPLDAYDDVVYPVAQFSVKNAGAVDSSEKKVTYTVENANGLGVTTFRLVMPQGEDNIEVCYSCMDSKGEPVKDSAGKISEKKMSLSLPRNNKTGVILKRTQDMIGQGYYFYQVTYNVKSFEANVSYFEGSSPGLSGGMVYGRITDRSKIFAEAELLSIKLEIESINTGEISDNVQSIKDVSCTYKVNGSNHEDTLCVTMGITNQDPLEKNSFVAGEKVKVKATLQMSNYPYYVKSAIKYPVYYLRLPKNELSLVDGSVTVNLEGVSAIVQTPFPETDNQGSETGYIITPINFSKGPEKKEVLIGFYDEELKEIEGRKEITITFELASNPNINATKQYNLRDLVGVSAMDAKLKEQSGGWVKYNWEHKITGELIYSKSNVCMTYDSGLGNKAIFTVVAMVPMINFEAKIKNTANSIYDTKYTFIGDKGALDYCVSFENTVGGEVDGENFYYIIELPKQDAQLANNSGGGKSDFSLSLTQAVKIESQFKGLYDIGYSVNIPPSENADAYFDNGCADFESKEGKYATFVSENNIQGNWEKVRCIKIIVKKSNEQKRIIPQGEKCTITLENITWNAETAKDNGTFSWCSYGRQRYTQDGQISEGYTNSNKVEFAIHPYQIRKEVTLTGVVKGENVVGAVKEMDIMIPSYSKDMTLNLSEVSGVSGKLHLVTSNQITQFDAGEMAGVETSWGDQNFCLHAKLGEGTEVDILNETANNQMGNIPANAADGTRLTIKLICSKKISTNPDVGSITLKFGTVEGVDIMIQINLRTVGEKMRDGDIQVKIKEGKVFAGMTDTQTNVNVTADSAVSVQFDITNYLNSYYGEPYLSGEFSNGLSIIMVNITDNTRPEYYYYKIKNVEETKILLNTFCKMKNESERFSKDSLGIDSKLVFVINYEETAAENTGNKSLALTLPVTGSIPENESGGELRKEINWQTSAKRTFTLMPAPEQELSMESKGELNLGIEIKSEKLMGNDTKHNNHRDPDNPNNSKNDSITLALMLFTSDGKSGIKYPSGSYVEVGGVEYKTVENKVLIPIGEVGVISEKVTAVLHMKDWGLNEGDYQLRVQVYSSPVKGCIAPGNPEKEVLEKLVVRKNSDEDNGLKVSLSLDSETNSRIVSSGAELSFILEYKAKENMTFNAKLYAKNGKGYEESPIVWSVEPVFMDNSANSTQSKSAKITLPSNLQSGTYRILFEMMIGEKKYTAPYNIIVE